MTTIYSSNFDSVSAGALPTGWVSSIGTWAATTAGAISGANAFGPTTATDGHVALYTGAAATADMQVDFRQKLVAGSASKLPVMGAILRSDSGNANHYALVFYNATATGATILLFRKSGGSYSQIGSTPITYGFTAAAGMVVQVRAKIVGSAIELYFGQDGALSSSPVASFTDTAITTAGYPGLYNGIETSGALISVDDFALNDTVTDTTAPTASSAAVANGTPTVVAITMSEFMDGSNVPAASAFTVSGHTVSGVSVSGTVINLTVTPAFANGEAARTVAYTQPGTAQARDIAGNLLANFSGLAVTNNVQPAGDTSPPTFVSAQVTNSQPAIIVVTMNETLAASVPPNSAFTASGGRSVTGVSISGTTASVTVNTPYANGDTITISYTKPGANPRLQDAAGNATESFTAQPVTNNVTSSSNNALVNATGNVLFSPYNWDIQVSSAKTINAGAYFKTIFGGTSCTLNFDMTGIASPVPQISYRVDRFGPWITVPIAASVTITIPADTADYANKGGHLLEVLVKSMTETQARWSTQSTAVKLTGIVLAAGKTLSAPPALPLKAIFYGDSITEGVRTVNATAGSDTDRNDAGQGWSLEVGRILGAEVGNVGFGAAGFNSTGSGGVPALPSSYNMLYAGVARSFASSPDFIVLMHGTNDGGDVTANATTVLNGLIAATTAKIIVLRPFDGIAGGNGTAHASQLQAAVAACSNPSRCTYVNTAGFFTVANSADSLHPYGVENVTHIAPLVANAVRAVLAGATVPPTLTARTASLTLEGAGGLAANLTGLKVCFHDEGSPAAFTVPRYQSASETTDASGVLTFTVQSTLASGGTGHLTVLGAADVHFNGPVQVT